MNSDADLLRSFAREGAEDAFAELVRRHVMLVYSAALRQVGGDAHTAQDVTQRVFGDLARKAGTLSRRDVLVSWLHTSTRFAATDARRKAARRAKYEREAEMMQSLQGQTIAADWEQLRPLIDATLQQLNERDRGAVLLRFFEGRGFAEVGEALGVSEDAARMRVERALDRMRTV